MLEKFDFTEWQLPNEKGDRPLRPTYTCSLCQDTGWRLTERGAVPCDCRREARLAARRRRARLTPAMQAQCFANFRLDLYPSRQNLVLQGREVLVSPRELAEKALAAAQSFTRRLAAGSQSRGLMLEGEVGRGKSFLAAAIANQLVEVGLDVLFLVVPEFLDELRFSYQKEEDVPEADLVRRAQNVPVLVLDDLGAHNYSEWTKGKIFTLLNYRLNQQLPCIITTNLGVKQMGEAIGQRSVSRIMEMCDYYLLCAPWDFRCQRPEEGDEA